MLPVFSFVNVREAKFPILVRFINPFEESLSLFILRQVKEDFDDPGAVSVEMFFQVHDGTIPVLPKVLLVAQLLRETLIAENLRMHANDQYVLVIRAIEDAYAPAFGKAARGAPEKIMFQLLGTRLFEAEDLAPLGIDSGHDVPDGTILTGCVNTLQYQEQGIVVGRVVKLLQRAQLLYVCFQEFLISLLRLAKWFYQRRPLFEFDLFFRPYAEIV
jgi:hypothetical protein